MRLYTITLLVLFCINSYSQIKIDENFTDWEELDVLYSDATGDGQPIDFGKLWLADDENYLYYCFEVGSEINLQDNNDVTIYLDIDNNGATGKSVNGIGAEIEYVFGERGGTRYTSAGNSSISHTDLFLITAPTVTSTIFEGVIKKDLSGIGLGFDHDTIKVVLKDGNSGDMIPESGELLSYTLTNETTDYYEDYSIEKTDSSFLRFMTYNVERDGITDAQKRQYFERMITTLDPDIIAFQEIYNSNANTIAGLVTSFFNDGRNYFYGKKGPDNIILSKYPVVASYDIPSSSGFHGNGAFVVDMTEKYGVKALVISAHTPCCDNNEARQDEIDAIMAFVREAKSEGGTLTLDEESPIIIAGDMNLVGYSEQLTTFLTGDIKNNSAYGDDFTPDWDNTPFDDAKPANPNLPLYFTWYDEGSSFAPGRLDFIIYSGSVLDMLNSFSLFTPSMHPDTLSQYGLTVNDSKNAADHVPVIADFKLELVTGGVKTGDSQLPNGIKLMQNYPNPFNPETVIEYELGDAGEVSFKLISVTGELVETAGLGYKQDGKHSFKLNLSDLNSGVYFYQIASTGYISTRKLVLLK
ncbi:MAG: endonuclease [Melioribacteraceae bacterium]|nr:MAG: endonuclease [Melioribacteraceae bacterium]